MQGIVGQASDFKLGGELSVFFETLSQRSTELSSTRFDDDDDDDDDIYLKDSPTRTKPWSRGSP